MTTAQYCGGGRQESQSYQGKTKDLSDEKNHQPITCLNTSYKILTALIAEYMREYALVIKIWDEGQLGAVERVLGTADRLIIDRCIMEEVQVIP